jgi:hypothetical protein
MATEEMLKSDTLDLSLLLEAMPGDLLLLGRARSLTKMLPSGKSIASVYSLYSLKRT